MVDNRNFTYMIIRKNIVQNKIYWRCGMDRKTKCKARLIASGNKIISRSGEHNHPPTFNSADFEVKN